MNNINIEILGFKLKKDLIEIGIYDISHNPISFFETKIKVLASDLTNYTYLNSKSFKACLAYKNFFLHFDHRFFELDEAISFLLNEGYVDLTGTNNES